MSRPFPTRYASVLAVLALVVGACGSTPDAGQPDSTGGGDPGSSESGTEAALEQAASDVFGALLTGDDQVYFNALSRACRERLEFAAVQAHLSGRRFTATNVGGIDLGELAISSVVVDEFAGSSATVALVITGTDEALKESLPNRWVFEDGAWRLDECADIREAQGGLKGQGTDRSDPIPYGGIADADGWLIAVVYIEPDGGPSVVELGGAPAATGNQSFLIQVNLSYNGATPSATLGDGVAFAMVNGSTVYGDEAACQGGDPTAFVDPNAQVGPGESIGTPFLCREIATADAQGLLLRVTSLPTGTEFWFDLAQP